VSPTTEEQIAAHRLDLAMGELERARESLRYGRLGLAYDYANDGAREAQLAAIAIDELKAIHGYVRQPIEIERRGA
jgi:hypothetical protein